MFSIIVYLFVCYWSLMCCQSVDAKRTVSKRNDIDLQTCIDNFSILKDKIIRTQDSRNMGAKYLNEIDLGSRDECLRLCCETDTCDVFVYEEKNPGSCYLFHCGPPEDFKCKFTRHANYSSAVLAVNRHLDELESLKLTKHEQDLNSLRKNDEAKAQNAGPPATKMTPTQYLTTSTQKSKQIVPLLPTKQTPSRHCSRYQFECRSSSECIAIYNACDGIPQCSDGSDEAPELDCPDLGTTVAPSPQPPPALPLLPISNNAYGQSQARKPLPPMIPDNGYQNLGNFQSNPVISDTHDARNFIRPPQEPRAPQVYNDPSVVQNQIQQQYIGRPAAASNWVHQNNPMAGMTQNSQYVDKNSHIFNHKESGLQVVDTPDRYKYKGAMQTLHRAMAMGQYIDASGGGASGIPYGDVASRADYGKIPNYYGDVYRPQYPPAENWQQLPQSHADNNLYISNNDNWQPQYPQQNEQSGQMYRPNVDVNWKQELLDKQAESKTFDHTIIKEPKEFEEKTKKELNHPKSKPEQTTTEKEKHVEKHKHEHDVLAQELKQHIIDLQDGEAERPGGAILSLTLGVCLTCVMAILIGCRLRVVRRRMRRGGKSPYAHDADYLVNGMYL